MMTYITSYMQGISSKEIRYGIVFGVLFLAWLLLLHYKKNYPIRRLIVAMALYSFLFILFASTVFSRSDYGYYNYTTELFWCYRRVIEEQNRFLANQILRNILTFIPAGILFPIAIPRARFKHTFFFGLLCSGMIEVLQFVLQRGLFEWDDIVHNVLGASIGYWLILFLRCIMHRKKNGRK